MHERSVLNVSILTESVGSACFTRCIIVCCRLCVNGYSVGSRHVSLGLAMSRSVSIRFHHATQSCCSWAAAADDE